MRFLVCSLIGNLMASFIIRSSLTIIALMLIISTVVLISKGLIGSAAITGLLTSLVVSETEL